MNLLQSDNQWSQSIDPKRTMTKAAFFSSYASHYAVLIYVAIVLATGALSLYLMQTDISILFPSYQILDWFGNCFLLFFLQILLNYE